MTPRPLDPDVAEDRRHFRDYDKHPRVKPGKKEHWPQAELTLLDERYRAGVRVSLIVAELNGLRRARKESPVNRYMVIGKAHRSGLVNGSDKDKER